MMVGEAIKENIEQGTSKHSVKKQKALRKLILKTPNTQLNFHSPKTLPLLLMQPP